MATLGSTAKPTWGQEWWGLNAKNQHYTGSYSMPQAGQMYRLGAWVAGKDASCAFYLVLWDAGSGAILGQSALQTAASQTFGTGHSAQYEADLVTPVNLASGAQVVMGVSRNPAGAMQFGINSSGTHYDQTSASYPVAASGTSHAGSIGAYGYYTTNTAPNAPTLVSPADASIITDLTPDLVFDYSDPDNDPMASYDLQVDNNSDFSSPVFDVVNGTWTGANRITITYNGTALSRGVWYYWRARTADASGDGAWSATRSFIVNSLPVATKTWPTASQPAVIHNLADPAVWTLGGSHAKAQFSWSFSDANGDAQVNYQVQVGTDGATANVGDSGAISGSATSYDSPWALVMGTVYYWRIQVWDSAGESSGYTAWTTFKVRWGQAIYEYDITGDASSGSYQWANAGAGIYTQQAFLFATATAAAGVGRSAWTPSIGALTAGAWLNVMVRLSTWGSGVQPSLADMTFTYVGTAIQPEHWVFSHAGDWLLDEDTRRFGAKSLRCIVATTTVDRWIYPFRAAAGDDVPVVGGTPYVFSAFVRTNAALATNAKISLQVEAGGGGTVLVDGRNVTGGWLKDTTATVANIPNGIYATPDDWQRLSVRFTAPAGDSTVRPTIKYHHNGTVAGDKFWIDAAKLEEGTVATAWSPGLVGRALIADAGGFAVDAVYGGSFRLRGSGGGTDDIVELGSHGLVVGNRQLLSRTNSFPASPTTGDTAFRADYGMWFYYNGTRWLSTQLISIPYYLAGITASPTYVRGDTPWGLGTDFWYQSITLSVKVSTTHTAANYWNLVLYDEGTGVVATLPTSWAIIPSVGGLGNNIATVGALSSNTAADAWSAIRCMVTGAPGALDLYATAWGRVVAT